VLEALRAYDFPGNVRELENILERALAFANDGRIEVADLALKGAPVVEAIVPLPTPTTPAPYLAASEAAALRIPLAPVTLDPAALEARDRELDATGRLTRTGAPGSKTWGRTSRGGQVGVPRWRQVNEKLGGRIAGHVELDTERQRGSRCPLGSDRVSKETTETKPRDALRLGRSIVGAPTDMPCFLG